LRDLKRLLALPGNVVQMDFLESHPLIRSLDAYRTHPEKITGLPWVPGVTLTLQQILGRLKCGVENVFMERG
jgi:hypothetical protein